jgi:hypothetical protein
LHVQDNNPLMLTTTGCGGAIASYQITRGGTEIQHGNMTENPAGTYNAQIPALTSARGNARVVISLTCPGNPVTMIPFDIYIDPSGVVKNTAGVPIDSATVTLYRADAASGPFTQVPNASGILSPSNRDNPDTTDAAGRFGWDVIAGYYIVRAEKAGCTAPGNPAQAYVESPVLSVPPATVGIQLPLFCGESSVHRLQLPLVIR